MSDVGKGFRSVFEGKTVGELLGIYTAYACIAFALACFLVGVGLI
jgi:hypothetical protein